MGMKSAFPVFVPSVCFRHRVLECYGSISKYETSNSKKIIRACKNRNINMCVISFIYIHMNLSLKQIVTFNSAFP